MIEDRRCPRGRVMAPRAVRHCKGWPGGRVHWVICLLPFRQVTSRVTAIRRRDRQVVVVVEVASGAGHVRMPVR